MVKLQKLVLRNFKSFKKADIPVSRGFTAIVGSNGSGKTNILDGLLFVLGISSMKMLRVSRIDELVNSNSTENYAKVELVLKDKDKTYEVQRMIDKQGKCVYRLDGKRKTRNEIVSLLLELGIRPEGHNIVVQGDTTRVIEMNPIERRQIIDELAGLQEFDAKKEEALKELQKVDNRLRDAGIILQERENYLEQLRKDKEAAAQFETLQQLSKTIKATMLFGEIEAIEKEEKQCKEKLEAIESQRKRLEEEIAQSISEKSSLREKSEKFNQEILAQKEKAYATFGAKLEEAKTTKALLGERFENKKLHVERNETRAAELEGRGSGFESKVRESNARIKQIELQLVELKSRLKDAAEKKAELQKIAEEKEKKAKEIREEAEALSTELSKLNEALFEKKSSLAALQKELEQNKNEMRETMQFIETAEAKANEKEKKAALLLQIEKKYEGLEEKLRQAMKESEKALEALKEAEAEKKTLLEGIELLQKSIAKCPVCEATLEKEKKVSILGKKQEMLKAILKRELDSREKKSDLAKKILELQEALEKKRVLLVETADLPELKAKLKDSRQKLLAIKNFISENSVERIQKETNELKEKAELKKSSLAKSREKEKAFQESTAVSSLQEAISRLNKAEKEEYVLQQEKEHLQSMAKQLLGQKEEALAEAESLKAEAQNLGREIAAGEKELQKADIEVAKLESKLEESEKEAKRMMQEKEGIDKSSLLLEEKVREKQTKQKNLGQQENSLMIEKSKHEVRIADLREEAIEFQNIERVKEFDPKSLNEKLKENSKKIEQLGAINMKALESYNQLEAEVIDTRQKVQKLDEERLAVVDMIEKIDVKRTGVFMQCFEELNKNFSKMFTSLFGGEGVLELSSKENPLEAGLLIQAKHKGNAIRNIDSMSGGEKTMTALAFLFAIQLYEPAPFYVFDEADAALDKENSIKMAKIIKEISRQSQFIAITHNDPLVQEADQIIGVALSKDKSSVIGLKLREKEIETNS